MSIGSFLEKGDPPTKKEKEQALGAKWELFLTLTAFLREKYQMKGDMNFGGKQYGGNIWYRRDGKTLVNLFPQKRYLVAQIVLGKEQAELWRWEGTRRMFFPARPGSATGAGYTFR
jgi:hypothetical protein